MALWMGLFCSVPLVAKCIEALNDGSIPMMYMYMSVTLRNIMVSCWCRSQYDVCMHESGSGPGDQAHGKGMTIAIYMYIHVHVHVGA